MMPDRSHQGRLLTGGASGIHSEGNLARNGLQHQARNRYPKSASRRTSRHSFESHLLQANYDNHTIQSLELLSILHWRVVDKIRFGFLFVMRLQRIVSLTLRILGSFAESRIPTKYPASPEICLVLFSTWNAIRDGVQDVCANFRWTHLVAPRRTCLPLRRVWAHCYAC